MSNAHENAIDDIQYGSDFISETFRMDSSAGHGRSVNSSETDQVPGRTLQCTNQQQKKNRLDIDTAHCRSLRRLDSPRVNRHNTICLGQIQSDSIDEERLEHVRYSTGFNLPAFTDTPNGRSTVSTGYQREASVITIICANTQSDSSDEERLEHVRYTAGFNLPAFTDTPNGRSTISTGYLRDTSVITQSSNTQSDSSDEERPENERFNTPRLNLQALTDTPNSISTISTGYLRDTSVITQSSDTQSDSSDEERPENERFNTPGLNLPALTGTPNSRSTISSGYLRVDSRSNTLIETPPQSKLSRLSRKHNHQGTHRDNTHDRSTGQNHQGTHRDNTLNRSSGHNHQGTHRDNTHDRSTGQNHQGTHRDNTLNRSSGQNHQGTHRDNTLNRSSGHNHQGTQRDNTLNRSRGNKHQRTHRDNTYDRSTGQNHQGTPRDNIFNRSRRHNHLETHRDNIYDRRSNVPPSAETGRYSREYTDCLSTTQITKPNATNITIHGNNNSIMVGRQTESGSNQFETSKASHFSHRPQRNSFRERSSYSRTNTQHQRSTKCKRVTVKSAQDQDTCNITDICKLPNDNFIIIDNNNRRIKLLDTSYNLIYSCQLSVLPCYVCHVKDMEIAVTLNDWRIQFVNVGERELQIGRYIQLSTVCMGIAHYNGKLYVTDWGKSLSVYNLSGGILETISLSPSFSALFSRSRHVTFSHDGKLIYVTDCDKGLITLNKNGKPVTLNLPETKAQGVCIDDNGMVYVAGYDSNSVIQVNRKGNRKLADIPLSAQAVQMPKALCFDRNNSKLLVTSEMCDTLTVLDLDTNRSA